MLEKEGTLHILGELPTLFQCIRYPSVGLGVLRWVEATTTPKYLEKQLEGTPFSLALVDEVYKYTFFGFFLRLLSFSAFLNLAMFHD